MTKAIVSLSGGQDSATCLAWTIHNFDEVYTISVNYGQRHSRELQCSKDLSILANAQHFEIDARRFFNSLQINSAMHDTSKDVSVQHEIFTHLPATFLPFRNLFLITAAAAKGLKFGVTNVVTGICQTDYSGYPDCRDEFRQNLETTLSSAIDTRITIHAPLMYLSKAATVKMMDGFGKMDWYKYTHTCYNGVNPPCGNCPSCKLRIKGFEEAGFNDPLMEE